VKLTDATSREWNSRTYHRVSGPQLEWGKRVVARMALNGGETLLDAGCGTGRITRELLQRLPHGRVVAVDLSHNMLHTAQFDLHSEFADRISFVAADLESLPFEAAFDVVFSTAAFHWIPDHNQLFRSLYRTLRPGGRMEAQCGGERNLERLRNRVSALSASPPYGTFLANYCDAWVFSDAETAARRLANAGFVEVKTWLEPAPTSFTDGEQYREFIANVILHRRLEKIPQTSWREKFLDELTSEAAADDPPFELDYRRLNLSARRAL
jgi:trans-aconitate 2-methyltransferase